MAGDNYTHIRVQVYYDLGGMNYATYKTEARGYYLSLTPVTLTREDRGVTMERFAAFSGSKFLLEETKRTNAKRLDAWQTRIGAILPELITAFVRRDSDGTHPIFALIRPSQ